MSDFVRLMVHRSDADAAAKDFVAGAVSDTPAAPADTASVPMTV